MAPNKSLRTYSRGNNISCVNPLDLLFAKNLTEKKLSGKQKGNGVKKKKLKIKELPEKIKSVLADESHSLHVNFNDTFDKLKGGQCNVPKTYKSRRNPTFEEFTHFHTPVFQASLARSTTIEISEIKAESNAKTNDTDSWFKQPTLNPIVDSLEIEYNYKKPSKNLFRSHENSRDSPKYISNWSTRDSPMVLRSSSRLGYSSDHVTQNNNECACDTTNVRTKHPRKFSVKVPSYNNSVKQNNGPKILISEASSSLNSSIQNKVCSASTNQTTVPIFTESFREKVSVHSSTPLIPNVRRNIIKQPLSPIKTNGLLEKSDKSVDLSFRAELITNNAIAESIREIKDWDSAFPKIDNNTDVSYHLNLNDFAGSTVQEQLINMDAFLKNMRQNSSIVKRNRKYAENFETFRKEFSIKHDYVTKRKKQTSFNKHIKLLHKKFGLKNLCIKLNDIVSEKNKPNRMSFPFEALSRSSATKQLVVNLPKLSLSTNADQQNHSSKNLTGNDEHAHKEKLSSSNTYADPMLFIQRQSEVVDLTGEDEEENEHEKSSAYKQQLSKNVSQETHPIDDDESDSDDPDKTKSELEELFGISYTNSHENSVISTGSTKKTNSFDKSPQEFLGFNSINNLSSDFCTSSVCLSQVKIGESSNQKPPAQSLYVNVTERKVGRPRQPLYSSEFNCENSKSTKIENHSTSQEDIPNHTLNVSESHHQVSELSSEKASKELYNSRSENKNDHIKKNKTLPESFDNKELIVNIRNHNLTNPLQMDRITCDFQKELVVNVTVKDIETESRQINATKHKNMDKGVKNDKDNVRSHRNTSLKKNESQRSRDLVVNVTAENFILKHRLSQPEKTLGNVSETELKTSFSTPRRILVEDIGNANNSTNIIDTFLNSKDDTFKIPLVDCMKRVKLKAGKLWRRSILMHRRESCLDLTKDAIDNLTTSYVVPRLSQKRLSMKIVPLQSNVTNRRTSMLQKYALHSVLNESENSIQSPLRNSVPAKEIILKKCGQTEPLPFEQCYPPSLLKNCKKIGEGVYGEVFLYQGSNGESTVMKVIPIEGSLVVNGERQKKFEEILSEIIISSELSQLRSHGSTSTAAFCKVQRICCVKGAYPDRLLDLWNEYDAKKGSENDYPGVFTKDQLYIVLDLANAGQDLEAFVFNNAAQACAMFEQVALALACAEVRLQFEHRDLHWGNVLLKQVEKSKKISCSLRNKKIVTQTKGVEATIIDFTLSRMSTDGVVLFNDLSKDPDLFLGEGDYQFEVYRKMRSQNGNDWEKFEPYSNVVWLHYILDKSIKGLRYKNANSKTHGISLKELKKMEKAILDCKSAEDFVHNFYNRDT